MTIHYDDKGKYFTDIVTKNDVSAIIQTLTHRIHGRIHVRQGTRLLDELNNANQFLPITDAVVLTGDGEEDHKSEFITLNRDHIVWILPQEEPDPNPSSEEVGT